MVNNIFCEDPEMVCSEQRKCDFEANPGLLHQNLTWFFYIPRIHNYVLIKRTSHKFAQSGELRK